MNEQNQEQHENSEERQENLDHFYEVVSHDEQYVRKFKVTGIAITFRFKNLKDLKDPQNKVGDIFQLMIDENLSTSNGSQFGVQISSPDLRKNFLIPFRPADQNDPYSIAAELDMLIQSNETASLENSE